MGRLVAQGKEHDSDELFDSYEEFLLKAVKLKTTLKKNINVLQHMMGYFKNNLDKDEKKELLSIIDQYGSGYVPLIVSDHFD